MKDIRPALRGFLLADAAVSAAVGGERVYPARLPQNQLLPSVVYNRITGQGDHTLQFRTNLARTRFQIDCWATTPQAVSDLANLVKDRLDGWRGAMVTTDSPPESVLVQGVFFDSERDDYDTDSKLYGVSRDYFIWVEEH